MIHIQKFKFNSFRENTYVVWEEKSAEAFIIDPGCSDEIEQKMLADFIAEKNLIVTKIINTHCHVDHILGNAFCKKKYQIPLLIRKEEMPVLEKAPLLYMEYNFTNYEHVLPDEFLENEIFLGKTKFEILHLPGHAPGHVALLSREEKKCFTGDVLFRAHIGRTDLEGGDKYAMKKSLTKLMELEDDIEIFPGHGFEAKIGDERKNVKNYILQD
ncbi:MAG: MBL fold metallo-hydrolase [Cytophagales bacterium]|jgi:glyoxylase-like metal-dependent hydrolase (beta-lactamase superfamily II)|nr:MBL fold metallo-hydrolase [Cytophagales bacterium]